MSSFCYEESFALTTMVTQINIVKIIISLFLLISLVGLILFFGPPLNYILVLCLFFSIIFFYKTKSIVYLLVFIYPLLTVLSEFTTIQVWGTYFSINIWGIINLGLVILSIPYLFSRKDRILQCRLLIPIMVFLGIFAISILFSELKLISIRSWIRYAMPAMVYFIILASFDEPKKTNRLLRYTLCCSFIIPFIFGVWQFATGDSSHIASGFKRIYGTLGHPNRYAFFLVVLSLLSIYFIFEKNSKYTWLYFGLFGCMVISLFFTFARVGWVSFLVSISILGVLRYRKFYLFVLICGILLLMFLPSFKDTGLSRLHPDASFWQRFELNEFGISLFKRRPIFGIGLGNYTLFSTSLGFIKQSYGMRTGVSPHNDYIKFLVEGGIIGLLAYLFIMYSALKLSINIFKISNHTARNYGAFLISLIAAILVFGITDQGFGWGAFYFWIFLATGEIYLRKFHDIRVNYGNS